MNLFTLMEDHMTKLLSLSSIIEESNKYCCKIQWFSYWITLIIITLLWVTKWRTKMQNIWLFVMIGFQPSLYFMKIATESFWDDQNSCWCQHFPSLDLLWWQLLLALCTSHCNRVISRWPIFLLMLELLVPGPFMVTALACSVHHLLPLSWLDHHKCSGAWETNTPLMGSLQQVEAPITDIEDDEEWWENESRVFVNLIYILHWGYFLPDLLGFLLEAREHFFSVLCICYIALA